MTRTKRIALAAAMMGLLFVTDGRAQGEAREDPLTVHLSNETLPPLVDLGPGQTYKGKEGGLYPGGSNDRPAAHDAAGRKIARDIVPLDADGNPDPVNGKIVFIPVSVSNAYGAWHWGRRERYLHNLHDASEHQSRQEPQALDRLWLRIPATRR